MKSMTIRFFFFFSSRRRHTRSVSAFLLNRSSDLLARKLSLRRKRSSPNVFEMAATETITSIILIKLIRVSLGTVRHPRRFKIVVIDIQITLKQMLRDFIGIRVNRAKKSGMVNIDRKSGSAGMPRPISYAVFCLKKKKENKRVSFYYKRSYNFGIIHYNR